MNLGPTGRTDSDSLCLTSSLWIFSHQKTNLTDIPRLPFIIFFIFIFSIARRVKSEPSSWAASTPNPRYLHSGVHCHLPLGGLDGSASSDNFLGRIRSSYDSVVFYLALVQPCCIISLQAYVIKSIVSMTIRIQMYWN